MYSGLVCCSVLEIMFKSAGVIDIGVLNWFMIDVRCSWFMFGAFEGCDVFDVWCYIVLYIIIS